MPTAKQCECCDQPLLLKNRYRAIALIGQGGFGRTFKGIDTAQAAKTYCAIKQFWVHPNSHTHTKAADLFRQEAQRLDALGAHRRIPALLDYVTQEKGQFLIQEYVQGVTLAQQLAIEGPWPETEVRQLLQEMLVLLQTVHEQHKIIHRDIKPENIIRRGKDGALMLVDFGAAKLVSETTLGMTGTVIGSAAYTAPEQVRGKAVFASDLYSLGVTCIHLLTQVPPITLFDSGENAWVWRPLPEAAGQRIVCAGARQLASRRD